MKTWQIIHVLSGGDEKQSEADIITTLLIDKGLTDKNAVEKFLHPVAPTDLCADDVGIDQANLKDASGRIMKAVQAKESIVVYADYDADGITAGAIMWETLWKMGARVMPYIPHREGEGYGLSAKGIDAVRKQYDPSLIITVDHGITAHEKVAYAKKLGIDVIVTDHHVKPDRLPDCVTVHTTNLAGSGVSWFVARYIAAKSGDRRVIEGVDDALALAALGTIADLVPLIGPNRSIAVYGLAAMKKTHRVGLNALIADAGITKEAIETYAISHMLAPRLNAMGRIEHALDALRLLCTTDADKAAIFAQKLGLTNKARQQMTEDTVLHAHGLLPKSSKNLRKLIFLSHESYNPGIIGLVAGKMTEEYYRPAVVVSVGDEFSKASARSIPGFNIIEAIRKCSGLLVDAGGHPMAAGFTIETKNLGKLQKKLETIAQREIDEEQLKRVLHVDMEIPLNAATESLWKKIREFAPFGIGNPQPVFASRSLTVADVRLIGATQKHMKFKVGMTGLRKQVDAIAFNMADMYGKLKSDTAIDLAYTIDMNEWMGRKNLQLKVRDIRLSTGN